MTHILVQLMAQLTHLSEAEKQAIEHSFPIKIVEKILSFFGRCIKCNTESI